MNEPFTKFENKVALNAKRNTDRDSLLLTAILRFPSSGNENEVRIRNLSSGGLMAEAPVRVARGEKVEISLRNIGWISGNVVWVAEGKLGIAFDHPIDPKDARKPVAKTVQDMPNYLKKLNQASAAPKNLRRI